jgi:hypothetical protein
MVGQTTLLSSNARKNAKPDYVQHSSTRLFDVRIIAMMGTGELDCRVSCALGKEHMVCSTSLSSHHSGYIFIDWKLITDKKAGLILKLMAELFSKKHKMYIQTL